MEPYIEVLDQNNRTLHGPIVWRAEICRNIARIYERKPNPSKLDLENALGFYCEAIHYGNVKVSGAEELTDTVLLNGARSVTGVAMGEAGRIMNIINNFEGLPVFEEDTILRMYTQGRDLVWLTRDIPNYDRLDAVEGRVLQYLLRKRYPPTHPEFLKTLQHLGQLSLESELVRRRNLERLKRNLKQR